MKDRDFLLIWLSIFIVVMLSGSDQEERKYLRWISIITVGIFMLIFYLG